MKGENILVMKKPKIKKTKKQKQDFLYFKKQPTILGTNV